MAVLVLRTVKGSPLTHIELDNNFLNLDAEIHQNMGDISLMKGDIANLIALSLVAGAVPPALPIQGSQWFDTTTSTLFVFDGAKWVNVGDAGVSSVTPPVGPNTAGDTWFDSSTNSYKVYDGSAWKILGSVINTGPTFVGTVVTGSLWYNTTTQTLQAYDGTAWVDVSSATYSNTVAPANPKQGTLWFNTTTETLLVYNGAVWTDSGETMPAANVAPTNASAGDLWYDTANALVMVYTGTVWKAAGGVAFSAVAPATTVAGSQWFDSATNTLYTHNGVTWVDAGSTTPFGTTAARPATGTAGDLYFNTTAGLLQLWDGSAWITAGAAAINDLSDVDTTVAPASGQVLAWDGTSQWKPANPGVFSGAAAPAGAVPGTLWFNTTTKSLMTYDGSGWLDTGSTTASGITASRPAAGVSTAGDTYFNTTTGLLEVFDGLVWETAGAQAINDLSDVDTTVAPTTGQVLAWDGTSQWKPGNPGVFSGAVAPGGAIAGTLWFNTSTKSLMTYDGGIWLDTGSTTNSGLVGARPAAGVSTVGDTYFNTTTGLLEFFDGTQWAPVAGSIPSGPVASRPAGAVSSAGDLYFNTTTGLLELYNGSAWVTAGAQSINDLTDVDTLTNAPGTDQTLLWNGTTWVPGDAKDLRIITAQAGTPLTRDDGSIFQEGDTYYDTAADKWYTYNGTAWLVSDVRLASATFQTSGQNSTQLVGGTGGVLSLTLNDAIPTVVTTSFDGRYIRSVSGVVPDPTTGNAPVSLSDVQVGTDVNFQSVDPAQGGVGPQTGTVFVIAGDPDPTKNGKTYIYNGTTAQWYAVVGYDAAALDARYVNTDIDGLESLAGVSNTLAGTNKDFLVHNGTEWVAAKPSVDTLGDVDTSTVPPTTGQALKWNGANWVPATLSVGQLYAAKNADPATRDDGSAMQDGDLYYNTTTNKLMTYNAGTGVWEIAGATKIDDLTDVDTTTNAPTTGQLLAWDGAGWIPGNAIVFSGTTAPTTPTPTVGTLWFNTTTKSLMSYDGGNWLDTGSTTNSGLLAARPLPAVSTAGDQYFNLTSGILEVYNGSAWIAAGASSINDLSDVDTTVAPTTGQVLAWDGTSQWKPGNTGVFSGAASPAGAVAGTLWFNTTTKSLMAYDGGAWLDAGSTTNAGLVGARPAGAVSTVGDTYFNTTTGLMEVYNGTAWVSVGAAGALNDLTDVDTTGQTAGMALVYNGTNWVPRDLVPSGATGTEPTVPAPVAGDQFFNTTLGALTVHNGTTWKQVGVVPVVTFSTVTPPVITAAAGDEYYVTSTGLFSGVVSQRWIHDGTQWVRTPASSVASINDLTDVDTTAAPASGNVLSWNGTNWVPVAPAAAQFDFQKYAGNPTAVVTTKANGSTAIAEGDMLWDTTGNKLYVYDGAAWAQTGGTEYIDALLDVDTTGKVDGSSLLMWDATKVTGGITGQWVITSVLDGSPTGGASNDF